MKTPFSMNFVLKRMKNRFIGIIYSVFCCFNGGACSEVSLSSTGYSVSLVTGCLRFQCHVQQIADIRNFKAELAGVPNEIQPVDRRFPIASLVAFRP